MKLLFLVLLTSMQLFAADQSNVLVYGEGSTQVNVEIDAVDQLRAETPINGSLMVTHDANAAVDASSLRWGDKPLKATWFKAVPMSSYSPLLVTIYRFQLPGMKAGMYTLPPLTIKVGGKEYQTAPLTLIVTF